MRTLLLLAACLAVASALPILHFPLSRPRVATDTAGCPVEGIAARCPPYKTKRTCTNYTERTYDRGVWVTTKLPDAARVETAGARGWARISAYLRGANEEGKVLDATAPLAIGFEADKESVKDYVVSLWIGERGRDAPDATGDDVSIKRFPSETYYVANWTGGPATQGVVIAELDNLVRAVKDGGGRVDKKGRAWLLSYSPLPQLTGRYYEIAVLKRHKKEDEDDVADAAAWDAETLWGV